MDIKVPDPSGFTVERTGDGWCVYLPHSCGEWDIAGDRDYGESVTQEEAVAALEGFIAEAQVALATLRRGEQT